MTKLSAKACENKSVTKNFLALIALLALITACSQQATLDSLDTGSAQAGAGKQKSKWLCSSDSNKQWSCKDVSIADIPATTNKAQSKPAQTSTSPTTKAIVTVATAKTIDQASQNKAHPMTKPSSALSEYPDNYYAVQLVAAKLQTTITDYLAANPQLSDHSPITLKYKSDLHLLVLGVYPDYAAAQAAVDKISPALKKAPWIRAVGPLKKHIRQ
ncbi:SPOR domain-containing protein [Oceanicoccus sp. KOV_DT_Chl]|uniref:SPOR domain-containing protein n=1 Tax=Oceanicoccus sp. KOV_DT_Chl TaxID=1904639 RepID=UPI0011AF3F9A|nr:hypothetical protein [Oceanicoccus sp. KOV_DT_Chl]